jgi:hypothetical protein
MPKTPIQAFKKNIAFYFKENHINPQTETDLFAKEVLCFSPLTNKASLDIYLKENFEDLYTQNATKYIFPKMKTVGEYNTGSDPIDYDLPESYITCALPDKWLATFDIKMPPIGNTIYNSVKTNKTEDFELDICYNRFFVEIDIIKDEVNNGYNTLNNYYRILIDPITPEDLESSLKKHYQTYLYMGMILLERDVNKSGYVSNYILEQEVLGTL